LVLHTPPPPHNTHTDRTQRHWWRERWSMQASQGRLTSRASVSRACRAPALDASASTTPVRPTVQVFPFVCCGVCTRVSPCMLRFSDTRTLSGSSLVSLAETRQALLSCPSPWSPLAVQCPAGRRRRQARQQVQACPRTDLASCMPHGLAYAGPHSCSCVSSSCFLVVQRRLLW
jgi:hypothetical protein